MKECICEKVPYTVCKKVPYTVVKQVPYTVCRMVQETCVKKVPYTVCRMEKQIIKKQCPYTVTRCVCGAYVDCAAPGAAAPACGGGCGYDCPAPGRDFQEGASISRDVCCTTCRMVKETCVKKVPYTVNRTVTQECVKKVPYTVCKMESQVICKQVPSPGLQDGALHRPSEGAVHRHRVRADHGLQAGQGVRPRGSLRSPLPQGAGDHRGDGARLPDLLLHPGLQELVLHVGFLLHDRLVLHQLVLPDDLVLHDRLLLQQRLLQHQCLLHDLRRLLLQGELDQEALPSPPVL